MATIVVGLDGAHWELLNPWLRQGELPALERIRDEGVWGDLQSCLPPVTSPNWKCYSTGKNPGKLGVYWWEIVDVNDKEIRSPVAHDFRSAELWDYLNDEGIRTAVLNMPTTYPPKPIDGVLVAGGPDAGETGYTYPGSLEATLESELDYSVRPDSMLSGVDTVAESTVAEYLDAIESRFDLAEWTIENRDIEFVHVTVFASNVFHHYYWDHEYTHQAWQRIDERIGELMDAGHDLLLMSDHGATEIEWEFNLNRWLEKEGYLSVDRGMSSTFERISLTRGRAAAVLDALPFRETILRLVPDDIKNNIPDEEGQLPKSTKNDRINWDETRAVASGQGPVYVVEDDEQREEIASELAGRLRDIRDPDGNHVFADVYRGSDVYHGPETDLAPALVVDMNHGYHVPGSIGEETFSRPKKWRGENKRTGLFAAWGEDIASASPLQQADGDELSITDLAPTVLHWLSCPVPEDIDGSVRTDLFADGTEPAIRGVKQRSALDADAAGGDTRELEARLEDLGYM
jgi:predicted AlkP superfamily phosphohydrolase/phosphomutase